MASPQNPLDDAQVDLHDENISTRATLLNNGQVSIDIKEKNTKLRELLHSVTLHLHHECTHEITAESQESQETYPVEPPPPLNIVIQIVGSRGDVQPFVALGKVLKNRYGHRVRLATHATFKSFVEENGLEFFNIGGNPNDMMAYMVKNPGLLPSHETIKHGDVAKRRKDMDLILHGCWRACIEAGDGMEPRFNGGATGRKDSSSKPNPKPFIADALIANPPGFAHIHCAEKLGIPLQLMFTMPWSPTQAFPHPLANIHATNADPHMSNFLSYPLVAILTWQGLGDLINKFREETLGLRPVSVMWTPILASKSLIPFTYCWSPALIPKPKDWGPNINIAGFYFLSLASDYTAASDLTAFLEAGPPPVYIGFGSIVVDDPTGMTKLIFEAVKLAGVRALVSKGWGGLGADEIGIPEDVFMLGNVPHDWLFKHVSAVVHHGGAGTTAAGIAAGKPTVVVPFFGDQAFWGSMVAKAGGGPPPVPYKEINAEKLAAAILFALKPETLKAAGELGAKIAQEDGTGRGAESFHQFLPRDRLRCSFAPDRSAHWRIRRTDVRLSAFAAVVLGTEGLISLDDLKLNRSCEYDLSDTPWDPVSGGVSALLGTMANLTKGFAVFPGEVLKTMKEHPSKVSKNSAISRSSTILPSNMQRPHDLALHSATETGTVIRDDVQSPSSPIPSKDSEHQTASRPYVRQSSDQDSQNTFLKPGSDDLPHPLNYNSSLISKERANCAAEDILQSTESTLHNSLAQIGHFPREFILSLARGFHNAPLLYHDHTVRQTSKVVGFRSGLKTAGEELFFGFYDGFTGVLTQPYYGAKEKGVMGFMKGVGKGFGGLVLKPPGAILGACGYTSEGIYSHKHKDAGLDIDHGIAFARIAQGHEELANSTEEERADVVTRWYAAKLDLHRSKKTHEAAKD